MKEVAHGFYGVFFSGDFENPSGHIAVQTDLGVPVLAGELE